MYGIIKKRRFVFEIMVTEKAVYGIISGIKSLQAVLSSSRDEPKC